MASKKYAKVCLMTTDKSTHCASIWCQAPSCVSNAHFVSETQTKMIQSEWRDKAVAQIRYDEAPHATFTIPCSKMCPEDFWCGS